MPGIAERRVLVAGASGLIGGFVAADQARRGGSVVAVARKFDSAQRFGLDGSDLVERPLVDLDGATLARLLDEQRIDMVVNCVGILQDGPGASTREVHEAFAGQLVAAIRSLERPILLAHLAAPGREEDDRTAFSVTKRRGEHIIRAAGIPCAILRPGFVVAPAAYGGSALLRGLAALPVDLPPDELDLPFAAVAIEDIAETIAFLVASWPLGDRTFQVTFDLVHSEPLTIGLVLDLFRLWLGGTSRRRLKLPRALLGFGAFAGDFAAVLGWTPPLRTTAL